MAWLAAHSSLYMRLRCVGWPSLVGVGSVTSDMWRLRKTLLSYLRHWCFNQPLRPTQPPILSRIEMSTGEMVFDAVWLWSCKRQWKWTFDEICDMPTPVSTHVVTAEFAISSIRPPHCCLFVRPCMLLLTLWSSRDWSGPWTYIHCVYVWQLYMQLFCDSL